MAISFVNDSAASGETGTEPTGTQQGDLMIALTTGSLATHTGPSGWTQIGTMINGGGLTTDKATLWGIVRGASAPALTWNVSNTGGSVKIVTFRGALGLPSNVVTTNTSAVVTSLTSTVNNSVLVAAYVDDDDTQVTHPSGMALRTTSGYDEIASLALPTAGATGSKTWTSTTDPVGTFGLILDPGPLTHLGAANLPGIGVLSAIGYLTWAGATALTGTGSLNANGSIGFTGTAALSGAGSLSVSATTAFNQYHAPEARVYIETEPDTWVNISVDVVRGATDRGRNNELDKYKTGTATLVFKDTTRKYDPLYVDGPLYGYLDVRHRMRIESFQNGVTYPIFFGYIDDISPARMLSNNLQVVTVKLSDYFKVLNKDEVNGTDFDSQLPGARINEVLDIAGLDPALRDIDDGETTLQAMTDVSSTLLSHVQTVAQTEFGDLFVQANGVVRFKSRDAALSEPLQGTFGEAPEEVHYNSLTPMYNDSLIRNPVSIDRVGGTKQTVEDAALTVNPPTGYGRNAYTLSGTYHNSDADALDAAEYILQRYKRPTRRVVNIGFGPVPYVEGPATYPHMLGRELGERIMIVERPMGVGSEIRQNSVIEGITHDFSPGQWKTKWNVSPGFGAGEFEFWTLGVSQLGDDTRLYF